MVSLPAKQIRFDQRSGGHEELANVLKSVSPAVRKAICDSYGFKLQLDGGDLNLSHDGQRIGSGSVSTNEATYFIDVVSKSDELRLEELSEHFGSKNLTSVYGQIFTCSDRGVGQGEDSYSFAFLIGLLEEISTFGTHFFNIYSTKKRAVYKARPIGKLIGESFIKNQLLGKYDVFEVEQLDNSEAKKYATVFYHTAISIYEDLERWRTGQVLDGLDIDVSHRQAVMRLKPFADNQFTTQLLIQLSKPPFPFGVKELFLKCLRYWRSKGRVVGKQSHERMAYTGFALRLNNLFEDYVGLVFEKSFPKHVTHMPKGSYVYGENLGFYRALEPDHIYIDQNNKTLTIVEVKYSLVIGVREHVAQLIAYLNYQYPEWSDCEKTGILVYPGTPKVTKLSEFASKVYVAEVSSDLSASSSMLSTEFSHLFIS